MSQFSVFSPFLANWLENSSSCFSGDRDSDYRRSRATITPNAKPELRRIRRAKLKTKNPNRKTAS